jgi:hypothetical protein
MLSPQQFQMFLQLHGVILNDFGKGSSKSVKDLWAEVIVRECELEQFANPDTPWGFGLRRRVSLVVLEIMAKIDGEPRYLLLKDMAVQSGRLCRDMRTRVTKKMFDDEDLEDATWRCMVQVLNIAEDVAKRNFTIDSMEESQEVKESAGFPGMLSLYTLNTVHMRVNDPSAPEVALMGLPEGKEFKTHVAKTMVAGSVRRWMWVPDESFVQAKSATAGTVVVPASPKKRRDSSGSFGSVGSDFDEAIEASPNQCPSINFESEMPEPDAGYFTSEAPDMELKVW